MYRGLVVRVLLVSTYELGHQPLHVASPAAALLAAGHQVRCLDLAVDGWDGTVVAVWNESTNGGQQPPLTLVAVSNEVICTTRNDAPYPTRCHGWNPTGYWTVASADSPLVELDLAQARFDGDLLRLLVSIVDGPGSRHLQVELSHGAAGTGQARWIRLERSNGDQRRSLSIWSVDGDGWATALVSAVDDATGIRLAADAFPILIPEGGIAA